MRLFIREATQFVNEYIQFILMGRNENIKTSIQSNKDRNILMFSMENNELVKKFKLKIEKKKQPIESVTDEIMKYKELLDDGIITEEEFSIKEKELLRKITRKKSNFWFKKS